MEKKKKVKVKEIKKVGDLSAVEKAIKEGLDRYNRIRQNIIDALNKFSVVPFFVYKMGSELENISVMEYQVYIITLLEKKDKKDMRDGIVDFKRWEDLFSNSEDNVRRAWNKITYILSREKVRVLELARIAYEVKVTAMERFITLITG